jgi:hypothetical protein
LHIAGEQRGLCLAQFSAVLDQFSMTPLAFEREQTKDDAGTALR